MGMSPSDELPGPAIAIFLALVLALTLIGAVFALWGAAYALLAALSTL